MYKDRFSPVILSFLFFLFFIFTSCTPLPTIEWNDTSANIVAKAYEKKDSIQLNLYVDATSSMAGYAYGNNSAYANFLDLLEMSAVAVWKNSEISFHKFGSFVMPVNRSEFLSAKNDNGFYHDQTESPETGQALFMETRMADVVAQADVSTLSIIITDLFETEGDVNTMVDNIKNQCFKREIMVGILPMKSVFHGTVYDVPSYPNGYNLNTEGRPFYAIFLGDPGNMKVYLDVLNSSNIVDLDNFLLVTNHVVKDYSVDLKKTKKSFFVNKKAPIKKLSNSFDFSMKSKGDTAWFDYTINYSLVNGVAEICPEAIAFVVNKKSILDAQKGVVEGDGNIDINIFVDKFDDNSIQGRVRLFNEGNTGNYSYEICLMLNPINGQKLPEWVGQYSTNQPIAGTESASKTYNLERFTSNLVLSQASINPIHLSKFYINIYKQ